MTPKEKAKDLYLQMLTWQSECHKFIDRNIISTSAKKCALITVDEILKEVVLSTMYWKEVKQEIQAL
jgi:hypothetical protein